MKSLYIVGAGGFGRELLEWLRQSPECGRDWQITGFLDDDPTVAQSHLAAPYLGSITDFQPSAETRLVMAVAQPKIRQAIVQKLGPKGAQFHTFVHPSVNIGARVRICTGSVICPSCVLTCDIMVGEFACINLGVTIGHDVRLGAFATVFSQVDICGQVTTEPCVSMGSSSCILPGRQIAEAVTVGAGSVVTANIRQRGITVFGNPAKRL